MLVIKIPTTARFHLTSAQAEEAQEAGKRKTNFYSACAAACVVGVLTVLQRCTSVFGPYACVLLVVGILAGYCVLMPVFLLWASSLPYPVMLCYACSCTSVVMCTSALKDLL